MTVEQNSLDIPIVDFVFLLFGDRKLEEVFG